MTARLPAPSPDPSPDDQLEGVIERITYANSDNGFSVLRLQPARGRGLITVVGHLPPVNVGEHVLLRGRWITHPKHGRQFEARSCRTREPATVEGIRKYLGSGLIKGIGPVMADRIVREFGTETLRILEEEIDQLRRVPGLGPVRVQAIAKGWEAQKAIKEIMVFLAGHQVSTGLAVKIYKAYGDLAIDVVKTDPYRLARDIHGIGFVSADRIARSLGLPPASIERVMAGLLHLLGAATDDGHVFLPRPELVERAVELLGVDADLVEAAIDRAFSEDTVQLQTVGDVEGVYLATLYYAELGLTHRLRDIQRSPVDRLEDLTSIDFDRALAYLRDRYDISLADRQVEAVRGALTQKVTVLTGGPGTGKTTTIRAIIRLLEARGKSFVLAAPTGRAAKRLAETTGVPAQTIHRLIGLRIGEGAQFHADNPLDVDLVILDEVSMMSRSTKPGPTLGS
ncbi:MAG TPA: helix-hairpin-helix domain-containing protein [Dehalococcoidia bacterium]|nr:helix-hairpin-helix domain-containing protein [Dehalococcoidia bacterium]